MSIRCVVVTPERTELDREADFVAYRCSMVNSVCNQVVLQ